MSSMTNSPIVAVESQTSRVPAFQSHETRDFIRKNGLPQSRAMMAYKNPFTSPPKSASVQTACGCPHVLVADDDMFQHFYYQKLFEGGSFSSQCGDLKFQLCLSGEELLDKYSQIKNCGCSKLKLVITDYYMGNGKLSGVDTSIKIRRAGYRGALLLRTSESADHLKMKHTNMEKLFEEKVIDQLVSKFDLTQSKEQIQRSLENK